ncbi:MAG: sulfur carrier protein ThiS [Phycisphaerae bacterium]|jgi:thiamine biosynthesis protein ThiS
MAVLKINGEDKTFDGALPETLKALLEFLSVNEATVVAEVDGRIIARGNFQKTTLHDGQKIELIRFVGGG